MHNDAKVCAGQPETQPTPLEQFTQRIEVLSDRLRHQESKLTKISTRLLGDVEREQGVDSAAPPNSGGGEYNNINYAIAVCCDRVDDMESLIQFIEDRF